MLARKKNFFVIIESTFLKYETKSWTIVCDLKFLNALTLCKLWLNINAARQKNATSTVLKAKLNGTRLQYRLKSQRKTSCASFSLSECWKNLTKR